MYQRSIRLTSRTVFAIEQHLKPVQINVRQQGRNHSPLRRSDFGLRVVRLPFSSCSSIGACNHMRNNFNTCWSEIRFSYRILCAGNFKPFFIEHQGYDSYYSNGPNGSFLCGLRKSPRSPLGYGFQNKPAVPGCFLTVPAGCNMRQVAHRKSTGSPGSRVKSFHTCTGSFDCAASRNDSPVTSFRV